MKFFKRIKAQHYMSIYGRNSLCFPRRNDAGQFFFILGRAKSKNLSIDEKLHSQLERHKDEAMNPEWNIIHMSGKVHSYKYGFNALKLMLESKEWYIHVTGRGNDNITTHPSGCHFLVEFSAFLYGLETNNFDIDSVSDGLKKQDYEAAVQEYAMKLWDYCYDNPNNFKNEFLPKIYDSISYIESLENDIENINSINRNKWNDAREKINNLHREKGE